MKDEYWWSVILYACCWIHRSAQSACTKGTFHVPCTWGLVTADSWHTSAELWYTWLAVITVLCVFKMLTFIDISPQCHTWQNMVFHCKPRGRLVSCQSRLISFLLTRSVRPLFALRLVYNSRRICQIDLKTKLWLFPGAVLLGGVMNEICLDISS